MFDLDSKNARRAVAGRPIRGLRTEVQQRRFEAQKVIYERDNEFYIYRDKLKWNRLWSAWLIEGGALYTSFEAINLSVIEKLIVIIFASVLIFFIYWLAVIDEVDTGDHLDRIKQFERSAGVPLVRSGHRWRRPFQGALITRLLMGMLLAFNLVACLKLVLVS